MNKRLIETVGVVSAHKATCISEAVETPLTHHVKIITVGHDFVDVMR